MQDETQLYRMMAQMSQGPAGRHLVLRRFRAGQLIYGSDDGLPDSEGLMVVHHGRLRAFSSFEGKELTLFTLDAQEAAPYHAQSMFEVRRDSDVIAVGTAAFRQLAASDPALALAVVPVLDRLLRRSVSLIEDIAFHGVRHRLIRILCDTARRYGRPGAEGIVIDPLPNAEDLAMQIGATRQSVSTVIAELIRDGLMYRFGAGALVISDLGRLQQQLSGAR